MPVAIAEHLGVNASMRRSAELTRNNRLVIFFVLVVIWILAAFAGLVSVLPFVALKIPAAPVFVLANMLAAIVQGVMASVVYVELRRLKEGFSDESIASVFD